MYRLRYLDQATDDLLQIQRYIARESGSKKVASQFIKRLRQQCQNLAELPGTMGRARPEVRKDMRSIPYGNYVIFFRYNGDFLEILSISEGHRDVSELF